MVEPKILQPKQSVLNFHVICRGASDQQLQAALKSWDLYPSVAYWVSAMEPNKKKKKQEGGWHTHLVLNMGQRRTTVGPLVKHLRAQLAKADIQVKGHDDYATGFRYITQPSARKNEFDLGEPSHSKNHPLGAALVEMLQKQDRMKIIRLKKTVREFGIPDENPSTVAPTHKWNNLDVETYIREQGITNHEELVSVTEGHPQLKQWYGF